jgi:hypothetical protein
MRLIMHRRDLSAKHRPWVRKRYSLEGKPDNDLIRKISLIALLCYTCREKYCILKTCFNTTQRQTDLSMFVHLINILMHQCVTRVRNRAALPHYKSVKISKSSCTKIHTDRQTYGEKDDVPKTTFYIRVGGWNMGTHYNLEADFFGSRYSHNMCSS